jgi:hypothetical protein
MEPSRPLEERIREAVHQLLEAGDPAYLQGLARMAFIDALENELRFLGLYRHNDPETPARIRAFVEEHADQWRLEYLSQQQDMPISHIEIEASPFVPIPASASKGILITKVDHYIRFTLAAHDSPISHMQISPDPA